MAYFVERRRNTPITTLIRNYVNKKSGKVADSRTEIQRRFDYLDWKDQKKIILAFLESGKSDRQWAYSKALDYWDKSFEPKVKELWERLHEEKCSWAVVRHFPLDYLSQNIDEFTGERDYFFLCLRLAADKNFVIDKDRLSLTDYLSLLYHSGRTMPDEEARDIPYRVVHKICVEGLPLYGRLDRYTDTGRDTIISPVNFQDVSLALYYLKKLNFTYVAQIFEEWNNEVQKAIFHSKEYERIAKADLDEFDFREARIKIARKYAYLALDDKYKQPSDPDIEMVLVPKRWFVEMPIPAMLKEMIAKNPSFEKLLGDYAIDSSTDDGLRCAHAHELEPIFGDYAIDFSTDDEFPF